MFPWLKDRCIVNKWVNEKHQNFQKNLDKKCLKKLNNEKEMLSESYREVGYQERRGAKKGKIIDFDENPQNIIDNIQNRKRQTRLCSDVIRSVVSSIEKAPESG